MAYIEIPFVGPEFLFNYREIIVDKYHSAPFMSVAWQKSLKYYEKFNRFADYMQPQYFVLKELKDRVTMQIAVPNDGFTNTFLYFEKCDGTRIAASTSPTVVIIPGDVNKYGQQLRRITWSFFIDDYVTTPGHYCWYVRVNYFGGEFEELAGMPMDIRTKHENTVLIEYTHGTNEFDVWFENIMFSYRIRANNHYAFDKLELLNFRNQKANLRLLYARNWRVYNFEVGFPGDGVNTWDQTKMYNIFKCDEVYLDGVRFLAEEEAEFEVTDYGNRYPLKKMKIQIVEYDQSDSLTVGSAGAFPVMRLDVDGYPFLIDGLTLLGPGSPGDPYPNFLSRYSSVNFQIEIVNPTELNTFFTNLESDRSATFRMVGNFYMDSGILYYQRGPGETYFVASSKKMITAQVIGFDTASGATDFSVQSIQSGRTSVTIRKTSSNLPVILPDQNLGNFTKTYSVPGTSYGSHTMRIYCDDLQTILRLTGTAFGGIKSITGKVSPILNEFYITSGNIPLLGIGFLLNAKYNLQYLYMDNMGILEVDNSDFNPIGDAGRWKKLKFLYLRQNKLNAAKQDKFYIDYYRIGTAYSSAAPPPGTLDTRFQTPASAPTGSSAAYRSLYAAWGFTVAY